MQRPGLNAPVQQRGYVGTELLEGLGYEVAGQQEIGRLLRRQVILLRLHFALQPCGRDFSQIGDKG